MVFIREETEGPQRTQEDQTAFAKALAGLVDPIFHGWGGAFRRARGERITSEDEKKAYEEAKNIIDSVKHFWPLLLIPLVSLIRKKGKAGTLPGSIDYVALSNVLGGYSDVIIALGWVLLSRVNDTIKDLSYTIVGAETIPAIDLDLPRGVNLGAWIVSGNYALDFVANTKADVAKLIETGQTSETTGPLDVLIATLLEVTGLSKAAGVK